ncbi:MAG: putative exported peptidase [Myxococcaceae bacterium]|nr:putative exported peptidase [Myxococcaceae bacterium]
MSRARQVWVGTFASLVVAVSSCASTPEEDPEATGATSEAVSGAVGNWTGFTSGQCVHGVYQFYLNRYGISLPGTCAHATVGNCQSCGACMIWKGPNVEPPASLFNKYAWGTTTPQTYDIVVYPPRTAAVGPGHVACVDHMTSSNPAAWQNLYVMDSNYFGGETMATSVHTVSRAPYGIFRLKSLDVAPNAAPKGFLDGADCTSISGWAQDPSAATTKIFTDLYFNGAKGDAKATKLRVQAGLARPDLCTTLGSCDHGYVTSTPRGTMDGAVHSVYAYGVDTKGGADARLTNAPKSITCTAPAIGANAIKRAVPDAAALKSWAFDTFVDMAPYSTADLAAVSNGVAIEEAPTLVQVAGQPDIFVVDGTEQRRIVNPTSFAAWRFTTASVKPIAAADLAALSKGFDWPVTPLLVKDPTADTVYMLDTSVALSPGGAGEVPAGNASPSDDAGTASNGDANGGSSGCTASPKSNDAGAWLLVPFAALACARRRRSVS